MTPIDNGSDRKLPIPARFRDPIEQPAMSGGGIPDMAGLLAGHFLSMPGEASTSPGAARAKLLLAGANALRFVASDMRDSGFNATANECIQESDALIAWATELADAIREL